MSVATSPSVDERVNRLSAASLRRVIEPDTDVPGAIGPGQILPDELLSVVGLGLDLTPEQRATLSREEVGSITEAGIRFEAVLEAGFALQVVRTETLTDPRITYLLHEVGEETRHQRLFIRLLGQIDPDGQQHNPLAKPIVRFLMRRGTMGIVQLPALLYVLVLAGEEIPDLFQKLASEHPDTDPFLEAVNRYHRLEEARHLGFARAVLPEVWQQAGPLERAAVRWFAPLSIRGMFETIVHPGVYAAIGLPTWETWKAVQKTPERIALRHDATRPVLKALLDAGVFRPGRVPAGWRRLCSVDRKGRPVPA